MILTQILEHYKQDPAKARDRQPGKGNPSASGAGKCAAQLQQLRYPELSRPEEYTPRAMMLFENGRLLEDWWAGLIDTVFGAMCGLRGELFYFAVPLPDEAAQRNIAERIPLPTNNSRHIWGSIQRGFLPPYIGAEQVGGKERMRLAPRDARDPTRPKPIGFILDARVDEGAPWGRLWVPVYVDLLLRHPELGLVVLEHKAVSTYAFRRALTGTMDYEKKCQLVAIAEATGLNVVWFLTRKETLHLLQVAYLRGQERTRLEIARANGSRLVLWADQGTWTDDAGQKVPLPPDQDWEAGDVWTPYDGRLLREIQERVLRVLLLDPYQGGGLPGLLPFSGWDREYGPSFVCETCGGTGTQTMAKRGGQVLKKPKPCEDCKETGKLDEAALDQFPCGYCSVVANCFAPAHPCREITDKPRWLIKREEWEKSGLTFTPARSRLALPEGEPDEVAG